MKFLKWTRTIVEVGPEDWILRQRASSCVAAPGDCRSLGTFCRIKVLASDMVEVSNTDKILIEDVADKIFRELNGMSLVELQDTLVRLQHEHMDRDLDKLADI